MKNKVLDLLGEELSTTIKAWERAKKDDDIEIMRALANEIMTIEHLIERINKL